MKPDYKKEFELWRLGYETVCGIDEAGRGALAGPLVAGAVILKRSSKRIFNDSKLLSRRKREELFEIIKETAEAWSIGICSVSEINRFGIQSATYLCFKRAIEKLQVMPSYLIIDRYRMPATTIPQSSITKGDRLCQSIAAASIIAKVTRDDLMNQFDKQFPIYMFCKHAGYGTSAHFKAIKKNGLCPIHRVKFVDKRGTNQLNFI